MKKIYNFISILFLIIFLVGCSEKSKTIGENNLAINVQDGVILHAWNWSYKDIEKNLDKIAYAGFSAVQTSPVQQPKGYSDTDSAISSSWWKLYQPISFSIGNAWLGTKAELKSLCQKAEDYNIKIIVDIVANHMANVDGYNGISQEIEKYEPKIYQNRNYYFRPYKDENNINFSASDASVKNVCQGSLGGLPDLNTNDSYIQERVLSLLKECIDCGVDGFRFDAAKHIETSEDGDYSSNFWDVVINGANDYTKNDLFFMGKY